jgi:hypothetical protein
MKNGKILGETKENRFYEEIVKSKKYRLKSKEFFSLKKMLLCLEKK